MSDKNIQVGAYGWLHARWKSVFYPDDMPPEWWLAYYSNEFNTVMVPADYWQAGEGFDCEEWLEDIHDEFRFYVECPLQVLSSEEALTLFLKQMNFLQSHLVGVLVPEKTGKDEQVGRLKKIAQSTDLFANTAFAGLNVSPVCQDGSSEIKASTQLAIFEDDLTQLRVTRVNVEAFVASNIGEKQQNIIIKHETLSASDLMKFRSVIEIMGL